MGAELCQAQESFVYLVQDFISMFELKIAIDQINILSYWILNNLSGFDHFDVDHFDVDHIVFYL